MGNSSTKTSSHNPPVSTKVENNNWVHEEKEWDFLKTKLNSLFFQIIDSNPKFAPHKSFITQLGKNLGWLRLHSPRGYRIIATIYQEKMGFFRCGFSGTFIDIAVEPERKLNELPDKALFCYTKPLTGFTLLDEVLKEDEESRQQKIVCQQREMVERWSKVVVEPSDGLTAPSAPDQSIVQNVPDNSTNENEETTEEGSVRSLTPRPLSHF